MAQHRWLDSLLAAAVLGMSPAWAGTHRGDHRHHRYRRHVTRHRDAFEQPYASRVSPTITCRYADGTLYDPDLVGGANHVGDGGPAANLGGFDPCGY